MSKYVTVQITHKEPPSVSLPTEDGDRCPECGTPVLPEELEAALFVCPSCDHHHSLTAPRRLGLLADPGTWVEVGADLRAADPLTFFDVRPYPERVAEAVADTGLSEAILTGRCAIDGHEVALGVMDFRFLGGSMGSVVGERFVRLVARAVEDHVPFVCVTSSGGARMQEGILSLMQMAKTVVALELLAEQRLPFVCVLAHPTTGGVLASFATLADVLLAEPGALLCFTGPRIIEQTIREKLPPDFGRAETNLANGQIDMVVHRQDLKQELIKLLVLLEGGVTCTLEPVRQDPKVLSRGGGSLAQAVARAKGLALSPRGWLFGRDRDDPGPT
jgi:acetyl-CoA carboxylase carboxyl transferase subunit beta